MNLSDVASQELEFDRVQKMLDQGKKPHVKFGIDPTSPHLHLGHIVPLIALRKLLKQGCIATIVIGDLTAQIGDPSGRSDRRPRLTLKQTTENAEEIRKQVKRFLGIGNWSFLSNASIAPSLTDLLDLIDSVTLNDMLGRSHFSDRHNEGEAISLLEFVCPLLQAWDSLRLECDLEIGGNDQLANCLQARKLMSSRDVQPQAILLFPLLLGIDGRKMSKSLDNHISLSHLPEDVFGRTMSISDDLLENWFNLLFHTDPKGDPLEDKKNLAFRVTELVHGREKAELASEWFDKTFRQKIVEPDKSVTLSAGKRIVEVLKEIGFASSNSDARRLIEGGGVKIDSDTVSDVDMTLTKSCVIQKGKRRAIQIVLE